MKKLVIMSNFDKQISKTKEMFKIIKSLKLENSLMIFDKNSKENVYKSSRNIPNLKLTDINQIGEFGLIDLITKDFEIVNDSTELSIGDDAAILNY